ncbi:Wadjet anti-phage system protein JetA family protein [Sphingobium scionense]
MRLAEFLCSLREGLSDQLGGLVIQVKNELEALQRNARENAPGLHKAARDAASFGRYLRSVLSALRDIDKRVVESDSVGRRLRHYFEDFVEKLLLQDYAAISTTSHPYRFRHRIFTALDAIEDRSPTSPPSPKPIMRPGWRPIRLPPVIWSMTICTRCGACSTR